MKIEVDVEIDSIFWDSKVPGGIVEDFLDEARYDLSYEGLQHIRGLTSVFKNPTGYYESQLSIDRMLGTDLITDNEVIYGPWLEWGGRGKFQGYHLWDKTYLWLQKSSDKILKNAKAKTIRKLK